MSNIKYLKHLGVFVALLAVLVIFFRPENRPGGQAQARTSSSNQLYLFKNTWDPSLTTTKAGQYAGAVYLTAKGNIIINTVNETEDTVRYRWGTYQLTDSCVAYQLTHEFYYAGKWDARWDVPHPDYKKGKSRPISVKAALLPSASTWKYTQEKDQVFYSWFFMQVPELAAL
jgi:hypothetical protein